MKVTPLKSFLVCSIHPMCSFLQITSMLFDLSIAFAFHLCFHVNEDYLKV